MDSHLPWPLLKRVYSSSYRTFFQKQIPLHCVFINLVNGLAYWYQCIEVLWWMLHCAPLHCVAERVKGGSCCHPCHLFLEWLIYEWQQSRWKSRQLLTSPTQRFVIGWKRYLFLSFDGLRTQTKEITLQIESKSDLMVSKKGALPAQRLLQLGWFRRLLVVAGFDWESIVQYL